MAEHRSTKSTYPSRYSPNNWVTPAQYIVELVCEQSAKHSKRDLPLHFWKLEVWSKFFVSQTRASNKLLKLYDDKVIIEVIKEKNIRSLLPKWVEKVIQERQVLRDKLRAKQNLENLNNNNTDESIISERKPLTRNLGFTKNKLDTLLELDRE